MFADEITVHSLRTERGRAASPTRRSSSPPQPAREPPKRINQVDVTTASSSSTNSVTRTFSDLDASRFAAWSGILCAARTAIQQPLNLALTRQQTCKAAAGMSTIAILKRIVRTEGGARGITQGMVPLVVGCALSESVYLCCFEAGREGLPFASDVQRDAAAGYTSDVMSRTIHLPLSVIAYRQMTVNQFSHSSGGVKEVPSAFATSRALFAEGGVRSLFCGFGTTIAIGCQWTAVWWAMYSQLKQKLYFACDPLLLSEASNTSRVPSWIRARDDNIVINSIASITTSACTAMLFNPFLVVRTRMQVMPNGRLLPVVKQVYRDGGMRSFWSGTLLNIGSSIFDGFLASTSYEYAKLLSDVTR